MINPANALALALVESSEIEHRRTRMWPWIQRSVILGLGVAISFAASAQDSTSDAARMQTALAAYDAVFAQEARDDPWATEIEAQIEAARSDAQLTLDSFTAECRATFCRIELVVGAPFVVDLLLLAIEERVPQGGALFLIPSEDPGLLRAVRLIRRDGFSLPDISSAAVTP